MLDDKTVLRLSLDAKAAVLLGLFSRGGQSRVTVKAWDHDFDRPDKVIPFGIFLILMDSGVTGDSLPSKQKSGDCATSYRDRRIH